MLGGPLRDAGLQLVSLRLQETSRSWTSVLSPLGERRNAVENGASESVLVSKNGHAVCVCGCGS